MDLSYERLVAEEFCMPVISGMIHDASCMHCVWHYHKRIIWTI